MADGSVAAVIYIELIKYQAPNIVEEHVDVILVTPDHFVMLTW